MNDDFFDGQRRIDGIGERSRRRAEQRAQVRRQRRIVIALVVVVLAAVGALAVWLLMGPGDDGGKATAANGGAAASATPSPSAASPSPSETASPSPRPSPSPSKSSGGDAFPTDSNELAGAPAMVRDLVPYGPARKDQMAAYSQRHYGEDTWRLNPKAIVLHYTAGDSYASAHATFSTNAENLGELPGVAAHFIIDKDGTIYQQVPLDVRSRHTIGLNHVAVGIEFVQEAGSGPSWAIDRIFMRPAQIDAGIELVAWLQAKYGITTDHIYGHGTANDSPLFKDNEGWRNDHVDWDAEALARFKKKLETL